MSLDPSRNSTVDPSPRPALYLSREGDHIEIKDFFNAGINPEDQKAAEDCKTHEQVLSFLEKLKNSPDTERFGYYHNHNPSDEEHRGTYPKGQAHRCALDDQIAFVRGRINDGTSGIGRDFHADSKCLIS